MPDAEVRGSGGTMGGLLEGKKILVTGVLDRRSIAYSAARLALEQGAEIVLSGFGRARRLTERTARRLEPEPPILELDVNRPEDIDAVAQDLGERWGTLDGVVHAIAFAPEDALGGNFLTAEWPSVANALESTSRYLARDLGERGIRVNLVSAGPIKTLAAKGISGFGEIEGEWGRQAPLGWETTDPEPVGKAVVSLLSDWWPATTGELIHVDGGYHAMGAPIK